ncbi:MAG TPA: VWA domain-containing protein [Xanthobacteraceae bacterium]|nr:VWA domain-containing protein [Xanthobacteraceae bacterium]
MMWRRIGGHLLVLTGLAVCTTAFGAEKPITLEARFAQPVMKAGERQINYLRISLNGCKPERASEHVPVNVAFVIDRSGSMAGERIAQAREAAIMAINRLDANDIASVVVFDDKVDVLVPAQKVTDRRYFADLIRRVGARGSTAIYAGVTEGANEVKKHLEARRLNRVVLLSDGLANVGPSRPSDFAQLGRELLKAGVSVSTIGLGDAYNEDLMLELAKAADGNHAYAAVPEDLVRIFNKEFDEALASCAQMVSIDVDLEPGARVMRAISREGDIAAQSAKFKLNQVYQETEHYVLLEVEVDAKTASAEREFGQVRVAYTVPDTGARQMLKTSIRGRFSASAEEVRAKTDQTVMASVVEQNTRERARKAIALRDQGKFEEAIKLFLQNVAEIRAYGANGGDPSQTLRELANLYQSFAARAAAPAPQWNLNRKELRVIDLRVAGSKTKY